MNDSRDDDVKLLKMQCTNFTSKTYVIYIIINNNMLCYYVI